MGVGGGLRMSRVWRWGRRRGMWLVWRWEFRDARFHGAPLPVSGPNNILTNIRIELGWVKVFLENCLRIAIKFSQQQPMFTNIEHDKKLNMRIVMRTFDVEILSPEDDALIRACARVLERIPEAKVTVRRSRARTNRADRESDAILIVNERKFETPYNIDCKKHIAAVVDATLRNVRASAKRHGSRPMVMVPYVNTTLGERLRVEKVDYVDAVGNAFIQAPPLFVDWSGRKPLEKEPRAGRLFSGGASLQLVALLLSAGESVTWSYRDLALGAGISLGSASLLMGEMRREGYLRRQSNRLENAADLLEQWMHGYHRRLRPKLFQRRYRTTEGRAVEDLVPLLRRCRWCDFVCGVAEE